MVVMERTVLLLFVVVVDALCLVFFLFFCKCMFIFSVAMWLYVVFFLINKPLLIRDTTEKSNRCE